MADPARARRLSKRISTIVASAIEYEIKDPGLAGVTITDAKVTADLHDATLYYTVLGPTLEDEPDYAGAAAALERAKGVLRSKVGAGTGVKFTPTLTFERDTVPDAAHRMEELLARAREADADVARVREGAQPAGEADPYRSNGDIARETFGGQERWGHHPPAGLGVLPCEAGTPPACGGGDDRGNYFEGQDAGDRGREY